MCDVIQRVLATASWWLCSNDLLFLYGFDV